MPDHGVTLTRFYHDATECGFASVAPSTSAQ